MKRCGIDLHIQGVAVFCQSFGFKKHRLFSIGQQFFDGRLGFGYQFGRHKIDFLAQYRITRPSKRFFKS